MPTLARKGKKRREKEAGPPAVVELDVLVPASAAAVAYSFDIRALSTDTIADVRRLLQDRPEAHHLTSLVLAQWHGDDESESAPDAAALAAGPPSGGAAPAVPGAVAGSPGVAFGDGWELSGLKAGAPARLVALPGTYDNTAALVSHARRLKELLSAAAVASASVPVAGGAGGAAAVVGAVHDQTGDARCEADRLRVASEMGVDGGPLCPPPRLAAFYDFFRVGVAGVAAPLASLELIPTPDGMTGVPSIRLAATDCEGAAWVVSGGRAGFKATAAGQVSAAAACPAHPTIVDALAAVSPAFKAAWAAFVSLLAARNPGAHVPTGWAAAPWLATPTAAAAAAAGMAATPPPAEDPLWGGGPGGWAAELAEIAYGPALAAAGAMAASCPADRLVRDRRLFIAHGAFLETAARAAAAAVPAALAGGTPAATAATPTPAPGGLLITAVTEPVFVDPACPRAWAHPTANPVTDLAAKAAGATEASTPESLAATAAAADLRAVAAGLVWNESSAARDAAGALRRASYRHRGALVRVAAGGGHDVIDDVMETADSPWPWGLERDAAFIATGPVSFALPSLRVQAHAGSGVTGGDDAAMIAGVAAVRSVVEASLAALAAGPPKAAPPPLRWECGQAWAQALRLAAGVGPDNLPLPPPPKAALPLLPLPPLSPPPRPVPVSDPTYPLLNKAPPLPMPVAVPPPLSLTPVMAAALESAFPPEAIAALIQRGPPGLAAVLNAPSPAIALACAARRYATTQALPRIIHDFAGLELSPVDGKTLAEYVHMRGMNLRALGGIATCAAAAGLPHVAASCREEMVTRAAKRLIRAVLAKAAATATATGVAVAPAQAAAAAAVLNALLGACPSPAMAGGDGGDSSLQAMTWRWLRAFVRFRFDAELPAAGDALGGPLPPGVNHGLSHDLRHGPLPGPRHLALLASLCTKTGLEVAPRDYCFGGSAPFTARDVVGFVPVPAAALVSSADGRAQLEASKAALDRGALDAAVGSALQGASTVAAITGSRHWLAASAQSLLAVVLYHAGAFEQAATWQHRALAVAERSLGAGHPDCAKAYGDLGVFYYRLQRNPLARAYLARAVDMLHLACGPEHPSAAAAYINVAMVEEGLGHAPLALRFLQQTLTCTKRLLGPEHVQTAAAYHALAIALSLMEAYALSSTHERTALHILQARLGDADPRTQDSAEWGDYFDTKAQEQADAARTGGPKPDASLATKGHLAVSDLLRFIGAPVGARTSDKREARSAPASPGLGTAAAGRRKARPPPRMAGSARHSPTGLDSPPVSVAPTDSRWELSPDAGPLAAPVAPPAMPTPPLPGTRRLPLPIAIAIGAEALPPPKVVSTTVPGGGVTSSSSSPSANDTADQCTETDDAGWVPAGGRHHHAKTKAAEKAKGVATTRPHPTEPRWPHSRPATAAARSQAPQAQAQAQRLPPPRAIVTPAAPVPAPSPAPAMASPTPARQWALSVMTPPPPPPPPTHPAPATVAPPKEKLRVEAPVFVPGAHWRPPPPAAMTISAPPLPPLPSAHQPLPPLTPGGMTPPPPPVVITTALSGLPALPLVAPQLPTPNGQRVLSPPPPWGILVALAASTQCPVPITTGPAVPAPASKLHVTAPPFVPAAWAPAPLAAPPTPPPAAQPVPPSSPAPLLTEEGFRMVVSKRSALRQGWRAAPATPAYAAVC